jgi:hypothetical protein
MPSVTWIRVVVYLTGALLFSAALALGIPLDESLAQLLGIVAFMCVGALAIFDHWAWKVLPTTITKRPDLNGTWKGVLSFGEGGDVQSKSCYLVIDQTYSRLQVEFMTNEGRSRSTTAVIEAEGHRYDLTYTYLNEPQNRFRGLSPLHRGTASLTIAGDKLIVLEGSYWNDRLRRGDIKTVGHISEKVSGFDEAERVQFPDPSGPGT